MTENKYKRGKIYSIRCYKTEDNKFIEVPNYLYIGSTCNELYKRFFSHKQTALDNNEKCKSKLYECMRETFADYRFIWKIELYENFPCNSKNELEKREGEIIRKLKPFLNSNVPGQKTKEELEELKKIYKKKATINKKNKIIDILENNEKYKNIIDEIKKIIGFENKTTVTRNNINNCKDLLTEKREDIYNICGISKVKRGTADLDFKKTLSLLNIIYNFYNKQIKGDINNYNKKKKIYNSYEIIEFPNNYE
jgi:hypothetical protein